MDCYAKRSTEQYPYSPKGWCLFLTTSSSSHLVRSFEEEKITGSLLWTCNSNDSTLYCPLVLISVGELKPQLLKFHHLWFVRHTDLVKCLQGNKIASLMKFHFMVRKTQEALKRSHQSTQGPGWHQARVFQLTSTNPEPTSSGARPHPSSNRVTFDFLSLHFQLSTFHFLFGLLEIFPGGRTELLEAHTFSHLFGTFITFIGWEAITSWEGPCVSYLWADVICLCEKVHLLLMINVWNSLNDRNPALLFQLQLECVSKCICILEWVHHYTVRKCTHSIKANCNSVCMCLCMCMWYWVSLLSTCRNRAACLRCVFAVCAHVRALMSRYWR